jgi:hypothetical protein
VVNAAISFVSTAAKHKSAYELDKERYIIITSLDSEQGESEKLDVKVDARVELLY